MAKNWNVIRRRAAERVEYLSTQLARKDLPPGAAEYLQTQLKEELEQIALFPPVVKLRKRRRQRSDSTRLRNLNRRIVELEEELKRPYDIGKYGAKLGIRPSTPCAEVGPLPVRYQFLKLVKQTLGKRPKDACLCHRCDNELCVRPDHFFWGTQADNMRDAVLKGRRKNSALRDAEALQAKKREALEDLKRRREKYL